MMYRYRDNLKMFILWGTVCVVVNILCSFGSSYDGDQSFWVGWVQQLIEGGFGNFKGNYPPFYVFWLWIVAQIHSAFGIAVGKTLFLKFMCLWPVFFAHLFLVDWICRVMGKFSFPEWKRHLLVGFIALNPALLLNGPIWGQVDLPPVLFALFAVYCMCRPRLVIFASMLYVLSLLTKFQMIMFLPVFGGLFIRNWRSSWKGLPFALLAAVLVLLPFAIGGNLVSMLTRAYVQVSGQYPYATFNAANLWMLVVGNVAPDNAPIWGLTEAGFGFLLKPAILGRVFFVAVSVFVLVKSILCRNIRTAFSLCTLNALAFFVVLPGMHERYLMYAIPASLCWCVWDMRRAGFLCAVITFVASQNVSIINPFRGGYVWKMTSFAGCAALVIALVVIAYPQLVSKIVRKISSLKLPAYAPYVLLSVFVFAEGGVLAFESRPVVVPKADNVLVLTELKMQDFEQQYKSPRIDASVEDRFLTSGDRLYKNGIGTHAPSRISFHLPENADTLYLGAGIDDEVYDRGQATFIVRLDDQVVWKSPSLRGRDKPAFARIPVKGARHLELVTEPDGDDNSDHTDWLNAYLKLR